MNQVAKDDHVLRVQKRVERLILGFGVLGTAIVAIRYRSLSWAVGFALGAALSWLNYRWLKLGVATIVPVPVPTSGNSSTSDIPVAAPKTSAKSFAKFFARYVLLIAALYVILSYSLVPGAAFLAGLFVVAAAVLAESLYQLMGYRL